VAFGLERFNQAHGLAAPGAAQRLVLGCEMDLLRGCLFSSVGVPEQLPDLVKQIAITVAEEAVTSDLDKALGQDVLQETTDEFLGSDDVVPGFSGVRVFVAKGHAIISHIQDAIVADGSGSKEPLLAPRPLRTGFESFQSSGSSR
jgi:hypothetical protein